MFKGIAILIGGVFVGAFGVAIVRRGWPNGFDNLYSKVGEFGDSAKDAFMDGYHGSISEQEASPAEA